MSAVTTRERRAVALGWARWAEVARHDSGVLAGVYRDLVALGVDDGLLSVAAAAIVERLAHVQLCRRVAASYAEVPPPLVHAPPSPRFSSCTEREARLLTIALELCGRRSLELGAAHEASRALTTPSLREPLATLLEQGTEHVRVGFRALSTASQNERRKLGEALPSIFGALSDDLERRGPAVAAVAESLPEGHGLLPPEIERRVQRQVLSDLLLPGFEDARIPVDRGRRWLSAHRR